MVSLRPLLLAAAVAVAVSVAGAASLGASPSANHLLRGHDQVHIVADNWWCGLVPIVSTTGQRASAPDCAPWDSGAVEIEFDARIDPSDLTFTVPLQIASYRRAHYAGLVHGLRVNVFSFSQIDRPKRPTNAVSVPAGSTLRFAGSQWSCSPGPTASITCAQIEDNKPQPPMIVVLPRERMVKVESRSPADLLSGDGGADNPFLYQING